jgi:UDP-N-acetylmuramate dehydrogenase
VSLSTTAPSLAELTTLQVGGPADAYVEATTEAELIDTIRAADDAGEPLLVVGGGSNLLVADEGFGGVVVRDARTGFERESQDACGGASVTAVGGQDWDDLVVAAVENGWVGIESLSGIPGTVGAAPVQNIGAYGQEVAGALSTVRTWDRLRGRVRTFAVGELALSYRTSLLKASMRGMPTADDPLAPWFPTPRYVVLAVTFQFRLGTLSAPVGYAELARRLDVEVGERAPQVELREAVLALRAGKGMLQDGRFGSAPGEDRDRFSAGSFFTNPVVPADQAHLLPPEAPRYPVRSALPMTSTGPSLGAVDPTLVKTSAAWLIDHAGFGKGFGLAGDASRATLSTKHTLALTNRGGASAEDVVALARVIRDGVLDAYGVTLEPEPVLVGVSL